MDLKAVNNPQVELTTAKNMTLYEIIFSAHCHKNKVKKKTQKFVESMTHLKGLLLSAKE